ncbi:acyltransferase domain-containing protein [Streptomyces sp. B1866]|uniref:acyltransferase domain-containing protein n=1 Tax=Streptomyces sp. B1866 TaxID=3075431 RepID=UPI00288DFDAB|nr:acyltransferase domain-containing protein [Streptomyces sp. B1866]MDT3396926.1 acyltransferase domain-containing protein [Streptomyces sp. B1866]
MAERLFAERAAEGFDRKSEPIVLIGSGSHGRIAEAVRAAVGQAAVDPSVLRAGHTAVAAPGTAAGRIAAALRLTGATYSLDARETPALLAVHLAAQALRAGDCAYALAGAELADGACAVLLARQSAAAAVGAPVRAVVRSTAAAYAPVPDDRARLLRSTLRSAGWSGESAGWSGESADLSGESADLSGESAGLSEEFAGLPGADDATRPAADGFPGLLAALRHQRPPGPIAVADHGGDGTTACLILDHPPDTAPGPPLPWIVSATSTRALEARAASLAVHLDAAPATPADIAHSLLATSRGPRRAAVIGADRTTLDGGLRALATGADAPHLVRGTATGTPRPVFVFPGQGSQWPGMAAGLLDTCEAFRDSVHACADALAEFVDWSLLDVLRAAPGAPPLHRVDVLQPTLWATMVSLAEVWRSYGVQPAAVVGHCYGEIAAAQVAGGLDLRDAARLLARRSRAWLRLVGKGTVISVGTSGQDILRRMAAWPGSVELAALNGPRSVALAGPPDALDDIVAELTGQGLYAKRIPGVETVGHCSQVETLRDHLLDVLRPVSPRPSTVPFYSTVDGAERDTATLDTDYWYRNTRDQVRFHQSVRALLAAGHRSFIEVSPHPLLSTSIEDTAAELGVPDVAVVGTLRRGQGGVHRVLTSVAEAYVRGVDVDWSPVLADTGARRIDLPAVHDTGTDTGTDTDAEPSWTGRVRALPAEQRAEAVTDLVRRTVAAVLEADSADAVDPGTAFKDMGLSSLSTVHLRNRLRETTGHHLSATVAYDHPTPAALARHLLTALFDTAGAGGHPRTEAPAYDQHPADPEAALLAALEQADAALEHLRAAHAGNRTAVAYETGRRIEERLKSLTDKARLMSHDDAGEPAADRFAAATDDEMFALIEERFGIS